MRELSAEENLRIVDAQMEAFNAGDLDRCLGYFSESTVRYAPGLSEPIRGRDALREAIESFLAPFPDMRAEKVSLFAQGDLVCLQAVAAGIHKNPFKGPRGEIPPTNSPVRIPICHVFKVENGEITEDHQYFDVLGFLAQLGVEL
ncbi:MAG: ester cyclase [Thermoplasmata archaeon]